jgi:uncharacterized integral membrane protein (TIGR00698 family)
MATQPGTASAAQSIQALPAWLRLGGGFAFCALIAAAALLLGARFPLLGAPIFAIVIGVVLTNALRGPLQLGALRIGDVSKLALRGGIILLGASLDLGEIVGTGLASLPLLIITIVAGLACALWLGRAMGLDWRMRCLIGMGTTICGASAIAALAPVIRARGEEIAYAVTVVFLFNMVAVFVFPALGHLMGLTDNGFGIWAGTAINDTSAVVAAGFSFSHEAGTTATIVKLTRTTLIIPLVIVFALALPLFEPRKADDEVSLLRRVYDSFPMFILLFLVASMLKSLGLFGAASESIQWAGRAVLVVAMAAVGLQGHWRAFVGAGPAPLLLGLATWVVVAVASLAVQAWTDTL